MANRILVVEDDEIARNNICFFVSDEGYRVDQASDGAEAIELLKNQAFSLVITDVIMPRVDGFELIQRVQTVSPQTPVLFMSSYPQVDSSKAILAGAAGFIRKPLMLNELLSKMRSILPVGN